MAKRTDVSEAWLKFWRRIEPEMRRAMPGPDPLKPFAPGDEQVQFASMIWQLKHEKGRWTVEQIETLTVLLFFMLDMMSLLRRK